MREIHIIRFPYSCYQCENTIHVTWPFNAELTNPEPLDLVGDTLRKKAYSPVQVVNDSYAIICQHCGARQGEFHIRTEAMHAAYEHTPHDTIEIEEG